MSEQQITEQERLALESKDRPTERSRALAAVGLLALLSLGYIGVALNEFAAQWLYWAGLGLIAGLVWGVVRYQRAFRRYAGCGFWFFALSLAVILLSFGSGVVSYARGSPAEYHLIYGFGIWHTYLDRQYRFQNSHSYAEGYPVQFDEVLFGFPNNCAVNCLAMTFGPAPGAYTGPVPLYEEALQLLAQQGTPAQLVNPDDPKQGITACGYELALDLRSVRTDWDAIVYAAQHQELLGKVYQGKCLLLGCLSDRKWVILYSLPDLKYQGRLE